MDFDLSERQRYWRVWVRAFKDAHIYPNLDVYKQQSALVGEARWISVPQIIEDLKPKARAEGLWNLFMNPTERDTEEYRGAGLTNLEYALCDEEMGREEWASEVFNCAAPDTGNMEVLRNYGAEENMSRWLRTLMAGEIRSAFLMTEPAVASSDATNIQPSMRLDGDHYVVDGRKWWSSGVGDPRCKVAILMKKTNPSTARHQQQSQILVPLDTPGIKVEKMLPVFGFDDAPHNQTQVLLDN